MQNKDHATNTRIKEWLETLHNDQFSIKIFDYLKSIDKASEFVRSFCIGSELELERRFETIQQLSCEDIKKFALDFNEYIQNNLSEKLEQVTLLIKQGVKFACFSEDIASAMMWGHYAESNTGFVLGYDFRQRKLNDCPEVINWEKNVFTQCYAIYIR